MKPFLLMTLFTVSAACGSSKPATTTTETPQAGPVAVTPKTPTEPPAPAATAELPAPPSLDPKVTRLAAEMSAFETAKPVFDKWCVKCHVYASPAPKAFKALQVEVYPFVGKHSTTKDIRTVLAIGGGKPSMPFDNKGAVKGDELAAIAAWADAWDQAETAGTHASSEAK